MEYKTKTQIICHDNLLNFHEVMQVERPCRYLKNLNCTKDGIPVNPMAAGGAAKPKVNNCPMINKRNWRQLTLMRSLGAIWHDKRAVRVASTFRFGATSLAPPPTAHRSLACPCAPCSTNSLTCHESYWTCVCYAAKWWWRLVNDEAPNGEDEQRESWSAGSKRQEEPESERERDRQLE